MRSLRTMQFLVVMVFFLVLMVTIFLPVIEQIANIIIPLQPAGAPVTAIPSVLTAVFVGMPLVMLGGTVLVVFVISGGLRGTSR